MVPKCDAKAGITNGGPAIRCHENSAFGDEFCIITDSQEVDDFPAVVCSVNCPTYIYQKEKEEINGQRKNARI